jgi:membrane protein DedA with SNARE-associated domain
MVGHVLGILAGFVMHTIQALGYPGVALLMAIESCCIPLPSEIIMPFSGFLVFKGEMNLWLAGLAGAIGNVIGSIPAYYLGKYGGRPLILKYGKYLLINPHDIDLADRWFDRHGDITVFVARMLPAIRTFIAFPAGVNHMNMRKFIIYTFVGSFPWCLGLAYAGLKLGENWDKTLKPWFHKFDAAIGVVLLLCIILYLYRHLKPYWSHAPEAAAGDNPDA